MAYEKTWANNPKIAKLEVRKLKKDPMRIFEDIPYYAEHGFSSIPEEEWPIFKWAGLYLQKPREAGYFMMRVVIPAGFLTSEQAVTLANIAKDYGRGVYDITTRQCVQFHWLTIEQIPDIQARLRKVGLSTAGACGDITRNIVGNPLSGIDQDELFDTSDIVRQLYNFYQYNEDFSNLPRKFKFSISASLHNPSNSEINDAAFVPATKVINGEKMAGFNLKVGGGLSAVPMLAQTLDVFVLPEQTVKVAAAISTIFRDYGNREKRNRNRLKFLVADWGLDKFKEKLTELTGPLPGKGEEATRDWNASYFYGIHQQKQAGLNYAGINIPVGRPDPDDIIELARISEKYGNGEIRNCNSQNLIISNIPDAKLEEFQQEEIFKKFPIYPSKFIGYAVSCTGTQFCNLALVETKSRMKKLATYLDQEIEIDVPVRIHMVGCPNSCGQRPIADIGLQGIKMKNKDKQMVEAYEIYVGGTLVNGGKFNQKLKGKVEASQLNIVVKDLLAYFKETKQAGESFFAYVERVGTEPLQTRLNAILESLVV